jgi:nucleoside-diphosphate-sugar epimerase
MVIHCAALSSPYGPYPSFYHSNFVATQKLLEASIKNGVRKFIFISTPSIYFNYSDRFEVKESDPLPAKMVNAYAATKLLAEQLVLSQNKETFQTIALRPRAIIGAEDTVIFPRVLEAYHKGRLKIIGNGQNWCDMTCASNVIEGIRCAMFASDEAYGEAYNITDGESINLWDTINYTISALGYPPVKKKVSKHLATFAASILEQKALLLSEKKEPTLTKYGIGILSYHFTLSIEKAKTTLNYQPIMKTMDGINEFILWHKTHP